MSTRIRALEDSTGHVNHDRGDKSRRVTAVAAVLRTVSLHSVAARKLRKSVAYRGHPALFQGASGVPTAASSCAKFVR